MSKKPFNPHDVISEENSEEEQFSLWNFYNQDPVPPAINDALLVSNNQTSKRILNLSKLEIKNFTDRLIVILDSIENDNPSILTQVKEIAKITGEINDALDAVDSP